MRGREQFLTDIKCVGKPALMLGVYWAFMHFIWNLGVCPVRNITGFPCPACGISRALVLFLKGDFAGAFRMHPFFYPVLVLGIWAGIQRYMLGKTIRKLQYVLAVIGVGMIVYYVYRMQTQFPFMEPMVYEWNSLMGRSHIFEQLHIAEWLKM